MIELSAKNAANRQTDRVAHAVCLPSLPHQSKRALKGRHEVRSYHTPLRGVVYPLLPSTNPDFQGVQNVHLHTEYNGVPGYHIRSEPYPP